MEKLVEKIWIDLHQELEKFIYSKIKDIDNSKDILQEVFLKIQLNIHTLKDPKKLTSWVYQITRNIISDHFRNTKEQIPLIDLELPENDHEEPLYSNLSDCINQKIELLPEKYKNVILLTSFHNYSQIQLAKKTNTSYSGLKSRVQRAKDRLKILILSCKNVKNSL